MARLPCGGLEDRALTPHIRETLVCEPASVAHVRATVAGFLAGLGIHEDDAFEVQVAVEEAAANAVRHGRPDGGEGIIELECSYRAPWFTVSVIDRGRGFDFAARNVDSPPDPLATGGRGLFLIHELAGDVRVASSSGGTTVTMRSQLRPRDRQAVGA